VPGDAGFCARVVGDGARSAVLHYVTAYEPLQPTDMLLIDAGAEFLGFTSDITRTLPVSGVFTPLKRTQYDIVFNAHLAALPLFTDGRPFADIARAAALALLEGLLAAGLVHNATVAQLYAARVDRVFMPHGLGHLLGYDVHDPKVYPQNLSPPLNITAGMFMTCERDSSSSHNRSTRPVAPRHWRSPWMRQ
jgi:Xaa-Pro aminopeptidase